MEDAREFQDWELLQNSDMGFVNSSDSLKTSRDFEGIEGDSEGVIRSDYFSLDSDKRYAMTVAKGDLSEESSVESDNPSWLDPDSEPRYGGEASLQGILLGRKNPGEFWPDSGSDQSVSEKFSDSEGKTELGFGFDAKNEVGFKGFMNKNPFEFWSDSSRDSSVPVKFERGLGNHENISDESNGATDDGGLIELDSARFIEGDEVPKETVQTENFSAAEEVPSVEEEKGKMVWWKLPLELLKFYVFRAKPVWSFAIAAAVMGFVIMGKRLYSMRRKSKSIQLKVTVEDKKVSQFMIRAARLNEAFSVVRRVPAIRTSLPLSGVTPWPVMSLR